VDARIFRLCMQDTARELAYGTGQLRYHLAHQPQRAEFLHDFLDRTEHTFFGIAASRELIEPMIVLAGGGTAAAQIASGSKRVRTFLQRTVHEYLERLAAAGLDRRARSRLPAAVAAA
jgi:hypothetical protein